ncbi:MAG: S8 family serine peptidase [Chloroflexi bacterium]|nr:S8 family serine peptidase [Chloroflexota bacterium]
MPRPLATLLAVLLLIGGTASAQASSPDAASTRWIVTLRDGTDVKGFVAPAERRMGFRVSHMYQRVARGFAATLTSNQRRDLARDPRVASIRPDRPFELTDQLLPPGVNRVQADVSSTADIDGTDTRVDADIAIIDTGIQRNHPDLNVAGGYNCVTSDRSDWDDVNGHGTHVAGIAAAKDNGFGVVGVAPGARLWAVRVFPPHGTSWESWIVCGLEWVAAQRDAADPDGARIESVNMSLRGSGGDDGRCGVHNQDLMHRAVCDAVAAGVTVVVAAGNDARDAKYWTPAAYDEAITVSAIGDFNGRPGGGASNPCGTSSRDDAFATFSNYGADVDLTAPGVCVLSTYRGSGYSRISGTSMAAPHVAGGAALYKAIRPTAKPSEVRAALIASGLDDWSTSTDRDSIPEPLLDVSSFALPGDHSVSATPRSVIRGPGDQARYRVTISRRGGFSGDVEMSVVGLVAGMSATFTPAIVPGTSDSTILKVTSPADGPARKVSLLITGTAGTRERSTSVRFRFEPSLEGGALAPIAHLPAGTTLGQFSLPTTVRWAAVAGATRYEFHQSLFERGWANVTLTPVTATSLLRWEWPGHVYRYRVRALVDGEWQPWRTGARHSAKDFSGTVMGIRFSPGDWTMQVDDSTYSTRPLYTSRSGATAIFTFRGREAAFVSTRDSNRGRAAVYVDGIRINDVDLGTSPRQARRVVFAKSWLDPGTHTIEVRSLGGGRVDVDAFIVFN